MRVERADALQWMARSARGAFDLVFLDPPFDSPLAGAGVGGGGRIVAAAGFVYVEAPRAGRRRRRGAAGLVPWREARAGAVHFQLCAGRAGLRWRARLHCAARDSAAPNRRAPAWRSRVTSVTRLTAVYPGTFDPMTLGHEDLMRRASRLFERLIVAVAAGPPQAHDVLDRRAAARSRPSSPAKYPNVEVMAFRGLLRDFVVEQGGKVVVRGLRAVSDFEYEFQMAGMNRQLMPEVETLFLTPSDQYQFVSGTFVREIASLAGDVSKFVSPLVLERLQQRVKRAAAEGAESCHGSDHHRRVHQLRRLRARVPERRRSRWARRSTSSTRRAAPSASAISTSRNACRSARWRASRSIPRTPSRARRSGRSTARLQAEATVKT